MNLEFKNTKDLFDYARKYDLNKIEPLESIFSKYNFEKIQIEFLLDEIKNSDDFLLLDARSEKENEESSIPYSLNFPVLITEERKNVGIIYSKYSSLAAGKLAMEYADYKIENLKNFLSENKAKNKNIFVHCWRGGGRSKYLAKMIFDAGYNAQVLESGFKSYRRIVNEFFNQKEFPYELIEINGMTGVGKTELLNALKNDIPVLDLEHSARHFSSLFGFVPYKIRNCKPVTKQSAFENDIYSQILQNIKRFGKFETLLIESESKKIGDFYIPEILYRKILEAKSINIIVDKEVRINRIINDYFGSDNKGLNEMLQIFSQKERLFRKELSNKIYDEIKSQLESGNAYEFTKMMIDYYYDNKYKDKGKEPLAIINNDEIEIAKKEILTIVGQRCTFDLR